MLATAINLFSSADEMDQKQVVGATGN